MDNKYYTPAIEDLYVGYECEIRPSSESELPWVSYTISADNTPKGYFKYGKIRTPYLTKEQVEAEGWEMYARSADLWFEFKESPVIHTNLQEFHGYKPFNLFLNYGLHDQKLQVRCDFSGGLDFSESDTLFEGYCPSINEFRKIIKWLRL